MEDGIDHCDFRDRNLHNLYPIGLPYLEHLRVLRLSGNLIKRLPRSFGLLIQLRQLSLDRNLLEELPLSFKISVKII